MYSTSTGTAKFLTTSRESSLSFWVLRVGRIQFGTLHLLLVRISVGVVVTRGQSIRPGRLLSILFSKGFDQRYEKEEKTNSLVSLVFVIVYTNFLAGSTSYRVRSTFEIAFLYITNPSKVLV